MLRLANETRINYCWQIHLASWKTLDYLSLLLFVLPYATLRGAFCISFRSYRSIRSGRQDAIGFHKNERRQERVIAFLCARATFPPATKWKKTTNDIRQTKIVYIKFPYSRNRIGLGDCCHRRTMPHKRDIYLCFSTDARVCVRWTHRNLHSVESSVNMRENETILHKRNLCSGLCRLCRLCNIQFRLSFCRSFHSVWFPQTWMEYIVESKLIFEKKKKNEEETKRNTIKWDCHCVRRHCSLCSRCCLLLDDDDEEEVEKKVTYAKIEIDK